MCMNVHTHMYKVYRVLDAQMFMNIDTHMYRVHRALDAQMCMECADVHEYRYTYS